MKSNDCCVEIFVSMLRGINVGGQKKVPMNELVEIYRKLKFENIVTYVNSGNVIFSAGRKDSRSVAEEIETGIFNYFGFEVAVIIRTADEMKMIARNNPFLPDNSDRLNFLYVTFMSGNPAKTELERINSYNYNPDRFFIRNQEIYLLCPGGYGRTKLNNTFFESKLKLTGTTRNWKTVNELLKITRTI